MDKIEIIGAIIGIIYLILEYKANSWLWLFGVLMPLFYIYLFFHNTLYANAVINIYYVGASIYGFWNWKKMKDGKIKEERATDGEASVISSMPKRAWWPIVGLLALCTAAIAWVLHLLGESEMAVLDGFTAALNVVGMYMLAKGWYQQWLCWIIVEPIMVILSLMTGMYPTAVMYLVYCVIAVLGYRRWRKEYERGKEERIEGGKDGKNEGWKEI